MFQPICAKRVGTVDAEKQTFENPCLLDNYNCDRLIKLEKLSDGECTASAAAFASSITTLGPVKFAIG